jgi:hypothetical protein
MHTEPDADSQAQSSTDESIARRRAILKRLGQGTVVAAAAAVPVAASAGALSRWGLNPSKRTGGSSGAMKLGVSG